MPFSVPTVKKGKKYTVPPAGRYDATIIKITFEPDVYFVEWEFTAEEQRWTITSDYTEEGLLDLFVDIGLAGQEVELSDAIGRQANILIKTYGGRTSAGVADVGPIA